MAKIIKSIREGFVLHAGGQNLNDIPHITDMVKAVSSPDGVYGVSPAMSVVPVIKAENIAKREAFAFEGCSRTARAEHPFDNLEGAVVHVIADGGVSLDATVCDGAITLDSPARNVHMTTNVAAREDT